jgi:Transposase IS116/IS110/IS902 family
MENINLTPVARLTKDIRDASKTLSTQEARFLVDAYYAMQEDRIRSAHRVRTLSEGGEPNSVMDWLLGQNEMLEKQVARALDAYSGAHPVGKWARSIVGIGPVITAGLLAHIDIHKAPTVGHIWRYAGLDPSVSWGKGQKCPWNQSLKRLCWLVGESFVKVSANPNDVYGKFYRERKDYELAKNEAGDFAAQAKLTIESKKFGDDTQARKHYESGKLPPAQIHARAKRHAVKLFLSHLHHVWYEAEFSHPPARPYAINILGHAHCILPPNWLMKV